MGWWDDLKSKFTSATQPVVDKAIAPVAPVLTTSQGAQSTLGTAPEVGGYTSAGGRRHRKRGGKTRKSKKGGKRTRKH